MILELSIYIIVFFNFSILFFSTIWLYEALVEWNIKFLLTFVADPLSEFLHQKTNVMYEIVNLEIQRRSCTVIFSLVFDIRIFFLSSLTFGELFFL